jgi:RNA polymerase sigma-70 factor (ECF subfamily)
MGKYSSAEWTDDLLLDLIRLEDNYAAFTELFRRYWNPLMTAAGKRIPSIEVAEELVQDVFLSFFLRRKEIHVDVSVEAYLKAALRHQVFKFYRSQKIHDRYVDSITADHINQPAIPDALMEAKQLREQIYSVAGKMPDKCREVFLLSRFEQLSHKDIAEKLGISVNTVKKHINKAITILREEFKDPEIDLLATLIFLYIAQ